MKLLLVCILLLSHCFIFFRFYFFINVYIVVFLFNNVIYVFFLFCLCILIVIYILFVLCRSLYRFVCTCVLNNCYRVAAQLQLNVSYNKFRRWDLCNKWQLQISRSREPSYPHFLRFGWLIWTVSTVEGGRRGLFRIAKIQWFILLVSRIGCWGEYLDVRGTRWQGNRESCITRSWMICTPYPILCGW
jgi:hypothetical protein